MNCISKYEFLSSWFNGSQQWMDAINVAIIDIRTRSKNNTKMLSSRVAIFVKKKQKTNQGWTLWAKTWLWVPRLLDQMRCLFYLSYRNQVKAFVSPLELTKVIRTGQRAIQTMEVSTKGKTKTALCWSPTENGMTTHAIHASSTSARREQVSCTSNTSLPWRHMSGKLQPQNAH